MYAYHTHMSHSLDIDPLNTPRVVVPSKIILTRNNYNLTLWCTGMPNKNFRYAWEKRNGTNDRPLRIMQGARLPNITINNLRPEDAGYYRCIASNSTGMIKSQFKRIIITGIDSYILGWQFMYYMHMCLQLAYLRW